MLLEQTTSIAAAPVPLVAIVSNPLSTTNSSRLDAIRKVVRESENVVHYELDGMHSVDDALALFARSNPALLVINGGDGTIGAILAALLHRNPFDQIPPIAYLPGGKTNMTAADLGFVGKPEKVLRRVIQLARDGGLEERLTTRQLIELDTGDGTPLKVGTFFGAAGVVKGIFWCREHAYSLGLPNGVAHVVATLKLLWSSTGLSRDRLLVSDPMTLTVVGGGRFAGQYSAVVCTTLDRLLLGLKPYGKEGKGGLRFSAIEAGGRNFLRAMKGLVTGAFGKKTIGGVHVRRADEVRIEGVDPVTLDGEIYHPTPGKPMTLRGNRSLVFLSLK